MNRTKRHESFITFINENSCGKVYYLPKSQKCSFVIRTDDCRKRDQFIDYTRFIYCTDTQMDLYIRLFAMVVICVCLFYVLGTTADKFFCPALTLISKRLRMSESIAGATLLAFGNASPDFFTALANFQSDTKMLYSQTFGGCLFLLGFVAALICIVSPANFVRATVTRDTCFFLFACIWLAVSFQDEHFTFGEALGAILIYLVYLGVIIAQHFVDSDAEIEPRSSMKRNSVAHYSTHPNARLLDGLLISINPIDIEEWNSSMIVGKISQVIKSPIVLVLNICVPVVDPSLELNGWSKLLNTSQVIILPVTLSFAMKVAFVRVFGIEIVWYLLVFTCIIAVLVFTTSRTDRYPTYHILFAVFGSFVGPICIIFICASEVVAILSAFGTIANLSDSFLGLSVLTFGNNIGDLIANVSLARAGYTKMAFCASMGSSIFHCLFGVGTLFMLKFISTSSTEAMSKRGDTGPVSSFFLLIMLIFTITSFCINGFQGRRSLGFFMLFNYIAYLLYCLLCELEIMHPYGTSHPAEDFYGD